MQSDFWAGDDRSGSTTSNKYFVIDDLIPGHQYTIEVTDKDYNTARRTIRVPNTSSFVDGRLKDTSITVSIAYRYRDASDNITKVGKFTARTMKEQISNLGYGYGLRYEISVPQLAKSRKYFTQLVFYAPTGYTQTVHSANIKIREYDRQI